MRGLCVARGWLQLYTPRPDHLRVLGHGCLGTPCDPSLHFSTVGHGMCRANVEEDPALAEAKHLVSLDATPEPGWSRWRILCSWNAAVAARV